MLGYSEKYSKTFQTGVFLSKWISRELLHLKNGIIYLLISVKGDKHLSVCLCACSETIMFASLFAHTHKKRKKKKNHWAARQGWSTISSILVCTNKLEAYLCTYSTQGENQRAWKHQVREKKNSHWLHMLCNVSASRSCCSQPAARFPRPLSEADTATVLQSNGFIFFTQVPQVPAQVNASFWAWKEWDFTDRLTNWLFYSDQGLWRGHVL